MKYRKKPVVIDAIQFTGTLENAVDLLEFAEPSSCELGVALGADPHVEIQTLEGSMRAEVGDWIIRGVKNELYPCKPDIFAQTYDSEPHP